MKLQQQVESLLELGKQMLEFNSALTDMWFKIEGANPYEMEILATQNKRVLDQCEISGKTHLRVMAQSFNDRGITIWVYSIPVKAQETPKWELLPENIGSLKLTPEQETEAENEIVMSCIGGIGGARE